MSMKPSRFTPKTILDLAGTKYQLAGKQRLKLLDDEVADEPAVALIAPLKTVAEIKALSPPKQLAGPFLYDKTLAVLVAPSGSGKSFTALDLAASIATGEQFLNQRTMQGGVVYVAAEGRSGLKYRLAAWEKARNRPLEEAPLRIEDEPLNLLDADSVAYFIALVKNTSPAPPVLIVIDTLARCMGGGDENSTQDMSLAVTSLDAILTALDCSVLVVHHCGWDAQHERGSTALRGAADVVLRLHPEPPWTADDGRSHRQFRLTCSADKKDGGKPHRDGEPFEDQVIRLVPIEVVPGITSCHIALGEAPEPASNGMSGNEALAFKTLMEAPSDGLRNTDWQKRTGLPKSSFNWAIDRLVSKGRVTQHAKLYSVVGLEEGCPSSPSPKQVQLDQPGPGQFGPVQSNPPLGVGLLDRPWTKSSDSDGEAPSQDEASTQEATSSQGRAPSRKKPVPDPGLVDGESAAAAGA